MWGTSDPSYVDCNTMPSVSDKPSVSLCMNQRSLNNPMATLKFFVSRMKLIRERSYNKVFDIVVGV
jgi:hypothetical protein